MNVVPIEQDQTLPQGFEALWTLYPRKVAKKDAQKAWNRLTQEQQDAALIAAVQWRPIWLRNEIQYCPHCSSWLNGERFNDELPPSFLPTSAAHVPVNGKTYVRGEMPEAVKAALRKLTGRA